MPEDDARRRELEARNAGLRGRIDEMLTDLQRRTEDLQRKQQEVAERSHEISSEDGIVTARVDASGTLSELLLSEKAFERGSPEQLARTITSVIREATGSAQQALQADFAPLGENTPDLGEFVSGAPSLRNLLNSGPLVEPPDPATERASRDGNDTAPAARTRPRRESPAPDEIDEYDDYDDPPQTFMRGDRW